MIIIVRFTLLRTELRQLPEIAHFGRILLIDGSLFPVIPKRACVKYKKGANAIKVHLAYELQG